MDSKEFFDRVYSLLPRIYRYEDKHEYLKRFLQAIMEGGLYPAYKETQGILNLIDLDKVPAKYLPHLASLLGFRFPYNLSESVQRTYIKNVVASYKMKGTEEALMFMIRELTQLPTSIRFDKNEKLIEVHMEIDETKPANLFINQVRYLVQEYAPPAKTINIVTTLVMVEIAKLLINEEVEHPILTILNNENYAKTKITLQENYGIIEVIDDEELLYEVLEELLDLPFRILDNEQKLFTKDTLLTEGVTVSGDFDREKQLSYLNISDDLHTASYSEFYSTLGIVEEDEEQIIVV